MRLIGLAVVLAVGLTLAPLAAQGQQAAKVTQIAYLAALPTRGGSPDPGEAVDVRCAVGSWGGWRPSLVAVTGPRGRATAAGGC